VLILRIDSIVKIFKKERYSKDIFTRNNKLEIRPVLQKKKENQTFDDLWDWRLAKGDMFIGEAAKQNVKLFHPNDAELANPVGIKPDFYPTDVVISTPFKGLNLDESDEEDEDNIQEEGFKGAYEKRILNPISKSKVSKKDIRDLIKMATMKPEEITKQFKNKKKKMREVVMKVMPGQSSPTASVIPESLMMIKVDSRGNNDSVANIQKEIDNREEAAKEMEKYYGAGEERDGEDFYISDDETKERKTQVVDISPEAESLKKFKWVRTRLKLFVQARRKQNKISTFKTFDDIKHDLDFQKIGTVDLRNIDIQQDEVTPQIEMMEDVGLGVAGRKDDPAAERKSLVGNQINLFETVANFSKNVKDQKVPGATPKSTIVQKNNKTTDKKKKKKSNIDQKEEDITPEMKEEENIIKYYQKKKYKDLKLDVRFNYEAIPQPVFNSILDILPQRLRAKKKNMVDEDLKNGYKGTALPLVYNSISIAAKKLKNKKAKNAQGSLKTTSNLNDSVNVSKVVQKSINSSSGSNSEQGEDSPYLDSSEEFEEQKKKCSQVKIDRKTLLNENEKFILKKPFPLIVSSRYESILKSISDDGSRFTRLNQVGVENKRGVEKAKKVGDFAEEELSYKDAFDTMAMEDQKKYVELKKKDMQYDYKMLYMKVRVDDAKEGEIAKFNWSGNNMMKSSSFTMSQTEKVIDSLNLQKLEQWMHGWSGFILLTKRYCREFIISSPINFLLLSCVFLNTLMMAVDGLTPDSWSDTFTTLNLIFTAIFTFECIIKVYGWGFKGYCRDLFNVFDALVMVISLVEVVIGFASPSGSGKSAASGFRAVRIFRIFRVLRVTRLLRSLRFMKVIIEVVKVTLEQFAYIAMLMFLFVFIFTLLGTQIFGGNFKFPKDGDIIRYNFDTFETAFYTSFMILTVENWNEILMYCLQSDTSPIITIIYFLAWIFIGNYIFLNLFLAVLLDGFENSENLQMVEEIEQEVKELERVHKLLIKNYEQKKKIEEEEAQKATQKVMKLIEPENYFLSTEIQKKQGCYMIVRDNDSDNESLSDDLNIKAHLENQFKSRKARVDPFEGVHCVKSLFYFKKTNPLRRFAARVVSHPYFETVVLVLIILGSIKLVIETYFESGEMSLGMSLAFEWIDKIFTICFTLECVFKILKFGFFVPKNAYLKDSWSILDFIIVISSIIDIAVESINLPILKVLRLLRTLRPLRFISQNQNMRIVVNALLESMIAILNVLIVIGMVWVMFAILGSNLMKDKLGKCNVDSTLHPNFSPYGVSKQTCIDKYQGQWKVAWWNFDDISQSMVTLYVLSTMEGWPKMFFDARDANDDTEGPLLNNSTTNAMFYLVFILIGNSYS
jgi:hypothetical protein